MNAIRYAIEITLKIEVIILRASGVALTGIVYGAGFDGGAGGVPASPCSSR